MKNFWKYWRYRFLFRITTGKKKKHYLKKYQQAQQKKGGAAFVGEGENNHIFLVDKQGNHHKVTQKLPFVHVTIRGNNNVIYVSPVPEQRGLNVLVDINGNNNRIKLDKDVSGNWNVSIFGDNAGFEVGENTACGDFSITLHHNNIFTIGKHCMISALEELWTDGHSVLDVNTYEVLNIPKSPIIIGDHVWLGRRCTLTKGAQIPNDCIVGIGSVVTKKFTEEHCVIAGNPARVVKRGITWNGTRPVDYQQKFLRGEIPGKR